MLNGLVSAGSKVLGGARFSLISVMPGFLVIAVIGALARAHLYDPDSQVEFDAVPPNADEATATVLFVFLAFLGGVLLRPFEAALVQLLEGYWATPPPLAFLRKAAVERHRRRRFRAMISIDDADGSNSHWGTEADDPPDIRIGMRPMAELTAMDRASARKARSVARAREIRRGYAVELRNLGETREGDPDGELLPTLLGNALLRGERLSGDRYGLDMPTVYPRLYPFISPRLQGAVTQQMDLISAAASLCISLTVTTAATLPLVFRLDWWSLLPLIPAAMAVIAYRGAVAAALYHGTLLATVLDLHRFDLIKAFHYELPKSEERIALLNKQISTFLASDDGRLDEHQSFERHPIDHPSDDQDVLQRTDRDGPAQA